MANSPRRPERSTGQRALRAELRSLVWKVLSLGAAHAAGPLTLRARDDAHEAALTLTRRGEAPVGRPADEKAPLFLSPLDAAVVNALGPEGCLIGKKIASLVSQPYSGKLKLILSNLVRRRVLQHEKGGQGFRWHPFYAKSRRG
jgi:hypothetical protein